MTEQGSHIFSDNCCIIWHVFFTKNDSRPTAMIETAIRIVLLKEKVVHINFELAMWPLRLLKVTIVISQTCLGMGNFYNCEIPDLSGNGVQGVNIWGSSFSKRYYIHLKASKFVCVVYLRDSNFMLNKNWKCRKVIELLFRLQNPK